MLQPMQRSFWMRLAFKCSALVPSTGSMTCFHRQMVSQAKQHLAQSHWRSIVFREGARATPKQRGTTTARAAARDVGDQSVLHTTSEGVASQNYAAEPLESSDFQGRDTGVAQRGRRRAKFQIVQNRDNEGAKMTDEPPEFVVLAGPSEGGATTAPPLGKGRTRGKRTTEIRPTMAEDADELWSAPLGADDDEAEGEEQDEDGTSLRQARGGQASTSGNAFEDMGVDDRVAAGLAGLGIIAPTDIQLAAIPRVLAGGNVAIRSYTGSGKTLAYMLPVLGVAIQRAEAEFLRLNAEGRPHEAGALQAIVVVPSRELAMQIVRVAQSLLPKEARGCVQQCIGGANPWRQADAIKANKPLMVVGTPGRLAELSRSGTLQTHNCGMLVLDEVDQLLAPNFREEMMRLVEHCGRRVPGGRQTIIASATVTPKVMEQAKMWCPDAEPVFVGVQREATVPGLGQAPQPQWGWGQSTGNFAAASSAGGVGTNDLVPEMPPTLEHAWVACEHRHRVDMVRKAIYAMEAQRVLVFMNFQQRLKDTEFKLSTGGLSVMSLHGEMGKVQRQNVLAAFSRGEIRALVVSDVAARGLDIQNCDAVINLELPSDAAHYAHRAGRTGRIGREGRVLSVVEPREQFVINKLAQRLGVHIPEVDISHGRVEPARRRSNPERREKRGTP